MFLIISDIFNYLKLIINWLIIIPISDITSQ